MIEGQLVLRSLKGKVGWLLAWKGGGFGVTTNMLSGQGDDG